jgi:hypothetical protein
MNTMKPEDASAVAVTFPDISDLEALPPADTTGLTANDLA